MKYVWSWDLNPGNLALESALISPLKLSFYSLLKAFIIKM